MAYQEYKIQKEEINPITSVDTRSRIAQV